MKPFEDMLPEEKESHYEELITLLQRAYRKPVIVPPAEQAQIITQVRERLMETDLGDALNEDMPVPQIGVLDSSPRKPVSHAGILRRDGRRFRLTTLLAAALVIAMLLGTPLLILRPSSKGGTGGPPTLTLSQNSANLGDTVQLLIQHEKPFTQVALTHDIQEPIQVNGSTSLITVDSTGAAKVSLVIDSDWKPGFHLIVAEDVATRYTASALLHVGTSPTPPTHLLIDTSTLDLGAAVMGANTIYPLKLHNSGGGSITWSASSDQPWLLVSPGQGLFSESQTVSIAGQRGGLKPGDYHGTLTISSNISIPVPIKVDMTVRPLPPNAGPVIALSPALLSFTATDGGPNPPAQSLALSNPGSRPLSWSLASTDPAGATAHLSLLHALGANGDWLSTNGTSGTVAPGATSSIQVIVQSRNLLPGAYIGTLLFTAPGGVDSPQSVNVSLTVQPHCGIVTGSGYLAFTAVAGQSNLSNQTLSLNATVSCAGAAIPWSSSSSVSWLTVTPANGQVKGTASAVVSAGVNAASLAPGKYYGIVSLIASQSTQTVMVQLTVQPPPPPVAPVTGASPLTLNFSNTQGQPNPTGQVVTITNNGRSPLTWKTNVTCLLSCWLGPAPSGGTIAAGRTGQVTINVDTSRLTPGNYVGQVTLNGFDSKGVIAPGSPQTITINLVVQPPCTISPPSSSSLSFSAVQGASSNPLLQTVMFTGWGSCIWPVTWHISPSAAWLKLAPVAGSINGAGQSGSIGVVASTNLPAGTYTTQVTISATDDSRGVAQGSPQTITVSLRVTGFTIGGSIVACADQACAAPQPLPGAMVTLTGGSTPLTTNADASGNYSVSNVALGTYTISVSGTDASNTHYVGSATVTVSGNTPNFTIQVFPG